jgi:hypothetical protein
LAAIGLAPLTQPPAENDDSPGIYSQLWLGGAVFLTGRDFPLKNFLKMPPLTIIWIIPPSGDIFVTYSVQGSYV